MYPPVAPFKSYSLKKNFLIFEKYLLAHFSQLLMDCKRYNKVTHTVRKLTKFSFHRHLTQLSMSKTEITVVQNFLTMYFLIESSEKEISVEILHLTHERGTFSA